MRLLKFYSTYVLRYLGTLGFSRHEILIIQSLSFRKHHIFSKVIHVEPNGLDFSLEYDEIEWYFGHSPSMFQLKVHSKYVLRDFGTLDIVDITIRTRWTYISVVSIIVRSEKTMALQ